MNRRLKATGLPTDFSPRALGVTTITDLLEHNTASTMASHTGSFDSSVQAFFQRSCRRLVGLYVIRRETRSASMAADGSTTIIRNVACASARGCTLRVGVVGPKRLTLPR